MKPAGRTSLALSADQVLVGREVADVGLHATDLVGVGRQFDAAVSAQDPRAALPRPPR